MSRSHYRVITKQGEILCQLGHGSTLAESLAPVTRLLETAPIRTVDGVPVPQLPAYEVLVNLDTLVADEQALAHALRTDPALHAVYQHGWLEATRLARSQEAQT